MMEGNNSANSGSESSGNPSDDESLTPLHEYLMAELNALRSRRATHDESIPDPDIVVIVIEDPHSPDIHEILERLKWKKGSGS
jgi:hypothetical protein